jgi:hypothetical protein
MSTGVYYGMEYAKGWALCQHCKHLRPDDALTPADGTARRVGDTEQIRVCKDLDWCDKQANQHPV